MGARGSDGPRVRVAAVILTEDRLVLVRHRAGERVYHLLPGGGVATGETVARALRREVLEETGLRISVGRPLFINDTIAPDGQRHILNLTFTAEIVGGQVTDRPQDPRVEAVDLVDPSDLASLDLRPPFASQLAEALAARTEPAAAYLGPLWVDEPA